MTYRAHYNNQGGTLGASLTNSGTTITFAAAPGFPTLASPNVVAITIDPGTTSEEIVWLTAYTGGATTGTILRGQEGTSGVSHSNGATWVHGPTALDTPDQTNADYSTYAAGQQATAGGFTATGIAANGSGQPADALHTHNQVDDSTALWLSGYTAETLSRRNTVTQGLTPLVSGQMSLWAITLQKGVTYTKCTFAVGNGGAVTPSHQWAALYDKDGNLLAQSPDGTSTVIPISALLSYTFASSYTATRTGVYYIALMVSGTLGSMSFVGNALNAYVSNMAPIVAGQDTTHTGLTTTAPSIAGSGGGGAGTLTLANPTGGMVYAAVG